MPVMASGGEEYYVRRALKSIPQGRFGCVIASSAEEAVREEKDCTSSSKIYTDGSRSPGGGGATAIMFKDGHQTQTIKVKLSPSYSGNHAELVGLVAALELRLLQPKLLEINIFTDSQTAIGIVKGEIIMPGTDTLLREFYRALSQHLRKHSCSVVTIRWIPGHGGIAGNVCAHKEARAAARGDIAVDEQAPSSLLKVLRGNTA